MKKSLIAAAVAGLFAAPAFAATSNVDVYGVMHLGVQSIENSLSTEDITIVDNTSRIGFKGSEDLGGGLKAIWQIESALGSNGLSPIGSASTSTGSTGLASRNTFIGLSGGFGTVLLGRHDTPYKMATGSLDPFADTIADYNLGRLDGVQLLENTHDARAPQALAYVSPNFSGFSVAAAVVMSNGENGSAFNSTDDDMDAYSLSATYTNGPLFVTAGYQDAEYATSTLGASDAWKIGVGYTLGDLKVAAIYEDVETDIGDRDSWQINGVYNMGPIALKAVYGQVDNGINGLDEDMWAIGAEYSMSKRTSAYVIYGVGDDDRTSTSGGDAAGWTIGVKHSF